MFVADFRMLVLPKRCCTAVCRCIIALKVVGAGGAVAVIAGMEKAFSR